MNFQDQLKELIDRVPGSLAAILMGFDGIAVAEVRSERFTRSLQDVSIEFSRILADSVRLAQGNEMGKLGELTLSGDQVQFVFRVLDDQYFLGLLLSPASILGKGRFELSRCVPQIKQGLI